MDVIMFLCVANPSIFGLHATAIRIRGGRISRGHTQVRSGREFFMFEVLHLRESQGESSLLFLVLRLHFAVRVSFTYS